MARSWCNSQKNKVGFEQMLKLLMHLFIFLMVNIFSWGMAGHSVIALSNDQNSSLVRTCSILVALFHPSNVQNFTSTSPPTSSNQLHKYHLNCSPECFSYASQTGTLMKLTKKLATISRSLWTRYLIKTIYMQRVALTRPSLVITE